MRRQSFGQSQVMDTGAAQTTVSAGAHATLAALGTVFPLLPNQGLRIFNISASFYGDDGTSFSCQDMSVVLNFLDSSGNPVRFDAFSDLLALVIACQNLTSPAIVGLNGFNLTTNGDPLTEVVSGFQVSNVTAISGVNVAAVQLAAAGDFLNTDGVNSHVLTGYLVALLSFFPRS